MSAQVKQLERELGQQLLDRSGRRVTPTEAGEAVLSYARAALAAVEGIRRRPTSSRACRGGPDCAGCRSGRAPRPG